jgi:hypothetical protein
MDNNSIQRIVGAVAAHLRTFPWSLALAQALLVIIAAGVGAFFGEYFRRRGRNLATKMDFDSLTQRLQANTELVEGIKIEVSQRDWVKREWANLRRLKLETLIEKLHECEAFIDRLLHNAIAGELTPEGNAGCSQLSTLQELYFPELGTEVRTYLALHHQAIIDGNRLAADIVQNPDPAARQKLYNSITAAMQSYYANRSAALAKLTTAAEKLLRSIVGL